MRALSIDVGSSSIRTALVDERGEITHAYQARLDVHTPSPGQVELDAAQIATLALSLAKQSVSEAGGADVVGITNQRATTIVFDPATGRAIGPALSWQDLRTVLDCLTWQDEGVRLAPNQSATKITWLLNHGLRSARDVRFATIDTWVAWHLSQGSDFITDRSNAYVTGLVDLESASWDVNFCQRLGLENSMLATLVDTMGPLGTASALDVPLPITAMLGDQAASLFGQSCVSEGTKITFGTGAMLDMLDPSARPTSLNRLNSGCYPIVARCANRAPTWAVEGIVLNAGSCVEWTCQLGLIATANDSADAATSVASNEGVFFVPALSGLGTPQWDFGARGAFFGLTRGTTSAHLVRAVLEGVAHRGTDLIDAAAQEVGHGISELRVDGAMSANKFLIQRLADFSGCNVAVSSQREATTQGAGLMALVGAGHLSLSDVDALWTPAWVASPSISDDERDATRATWQSMVERSKRTVPELSAVSF